jgi:GNAT superfamily N-acetyltransferase
MDFLNRDFYHIAQIWSKYIKNNTFYAPILGPVYVSGKNKEKLLFDILRNSGSGEFLDYDKNKRWFKDKPEKILISLVANIDNGIFLTTRDDFLKVIKIYFYSDCQPNENHLKEVKQIAQKANKETGYFKLKLFYFQKQGFTYPFDIHNIYLKQITSKDRDTTKYEDLGFYENLTQQQKKSFSDLGKEAEQDGFGFLWQEYLRKNIKLNPIICAVRDDQVIGAIGPLDMSVDIYGITFLHPPYFGVLKQSQRSGIGTKLWRSAIDYAFWKGARYTIVQNTPDSPAAKFYDNTGLEIGTQIYSSSMSI